MTCNITTEVLLENIRPFPKVIPSTVSRKGSNRLGRTRILTDTPETDKIEEDYINKQEKEKKKNAVKRRLVPLRDNTLNVPATRSIVDRKIPRKEKNKVEESIKENMEDTFIIEEIPCTSTRSRCGRLIKPPLKHNV